MKNTKPNYPTKDENVLGIHARFLNSYKIGQLIQINKFLTQVLDTLDSSDHRNDDADYGIFTGHSLSDSFGGRFLSQWTSVKGGNQALILDYVLNAKKPRTSSFHVKLLIAETGQMGWLYVM